MPNDDSDSDFECPKCRATVKPDWKACPNCGVEFDPPEEEAPTVHAAEPYFPAAPNVTALPPTVMAFAHPPPEPTDELATLHHDISKELARTETSAPLAPAPQFDDLEDVEVEFRGHLRAVGPPAVVKATPAVITKPEAEPQPPARYGGRMGIIGMDLVALGVVGALVLENWDTLVLGGSQNAVGNLQRMGLLVTVAVAGVGALALFLDGRRGKRRARRAG